MSMYGAYLPPVPPDLPGRFAYVIAAVCRMVAAHIATDRDAVPWIVAVWKKLNGISQRIQRLAAQIQAGTVPPLRAGYTLTKPRKPARRPPFVLPGHEWWLVQVIQQTAGFGPWLRHLLDDPEMPAMLAAAPQLARILRPLCRALGVTPPPLPPRPKRPAPHDAARPDPTPPTGVGCEADQGLGQRWATDTGPAAHPSPAPRPHRGRTSRRRPVRDSASSGSARSVAAPPGHTLKPA